MRLYKGRDDTIVPHLSLVEHDLVVQSKTPRIYAYRGHATVGGVVGWIEQCSGEFVRANGVQFNEEVEEVTLFKSKQEENVWEHPKGRLTESTGDFIRDTTLYTLDDYYHEHPDGLESFSPQYRPWGVTMQEAASALAQMIGSYSSARGELIGDSSDGINPCGYDELGG